MTERMATWRRVQKARAALTEIDRRHDADRLERLTNAYSTSLTGNPHRAEIDAWGDERIPASEELRRAEGTWRDIQNYKP